jgi:hypothetical protein
MFSEDYVRRMIDQVGVMVSAILGLVHLGRYPESLEAVDEDLQQMLGLRLSLVDGLPASELVAMLRWGERLDIGKMLVLAELLQAEGDVYAAQQRTGGAQERYLKALELVLEVAFDAEPNLSAAQSRVVALLQRLPPAALPEDLADWLAHYQATVAALPAAPTGPASE